MRGGPAKRPLEARTDPRWSNSPRTKVLVTGEIQRARYGPFALPILRRWLGRPNAMVLLRSLYQTVMSVCSNRSASQSQSPHRHTNPNERANEPAFARCVSRAAHALDSPRRALTALASPQQARLARAPLSSLPGPSSCPRAGLAKLTHRSGMADYRPTPEYHRVLLWMLRGKPGAWRKPAFKLHHQVPIRKSKRWCVSRPRALGRR